MPQTLSLPFRITINRVGEVTPHEAQLAGRRLVSGRRIYEFWSKTIVLRSDHEAEKEHLVVIVLHADLKPKAYHVVSVGSLSETLAHPREIFRVAVLAGGYAIVLVHNHPSGNCTPSLADRRMTKRMLEAAALLDIPLLDHVIVGTGRRPYFSFRENKIF